MNNLEFFFIFQLDVFASPASAEAMAGEAKFTLNEGWSPGLQPLLLWRNAPQ
jgi:hypothetical protein